MYTALTSGYRINLSREVGYKPHRPNVSRRRMVSFADTIPSLRIAVDLKVELFRNATKPRTMNAIHDIDALSMAAPRQPCSAPDQLSQCGTGGHGHVVPGCTRWTVRRAFRARGSPLAVAGRCGCGPVRCGARRTPGMLSGRHNGP